ALPTHLATCCSGSRLMSTYTANVIIMTSDHRPIEMESDHYLIKDLGHLKYVDKKITIIRYDSLAYAVRRRVSALQGLRDRLGQSSHVARPGPVPLVQVGQDAGRGPHLGSGWYGNRLRRAGGEGCIDAGDGGGLAVDRALAYRPPRAGE